MIKRKRAYQTKTGKTRSSLHAQSEELLALLGGAQTVAGVSIGAGTALRSSATCAAIRVIAETAGQLPVHVYRRNPDGSRERDGDHPAAVLLGGDANPWTHSTQLRTTIQTDALLHGSGYAQVVRAAGRPRELHRLDPSAVSIEYDETTGEPTYRVQLASGGNRMLGYDDVVHVATPGSAPGRPMCLIHLAREAIALDLIMADYQSRLFANGARPSGVLTSDGKLSDAAVKRLAGAWSASHGGSNSGRTAILENGVKFEQLALTSVDAQMLELRRLVIEEIARVFKVPLTLIGSLDRATWRNVEELMRQFVQVCLLPWLETWQAALTRALFTPAERKTYFIEFVLDDLLRGDTASRYAALRNAVGGAWLVPNEARQLENRPSIDGGDELIRQAGQGAAVPPPTDERAAA